jgi:hypothetical protein
MFHNWNFPVSSIFHSDRNCWFTFRFLFSSVDYYLMWPRQTTIPLSPAQNGSLAKARNIRRFLYLGATRSIWIGAYEALLSTVLFNRHWCALQPTLGRSTIQIPSPEASFESALQSDTTSYLNKLIMLVASKTSFHTYMALFVYHGICFPPAFASPVQSIFSRPFFWPVFLFLDRSWSSWRFIIRVFRSL